MIKHQNILSEIKWSTFRRDFAPGFEDILDQGVFEGWYDVNDTLQNLVFRWLAIPWIQAEIDQWVLHRNLNAPRAYKHKILPHGIPNLIRTKPHVYGSFDFKVLVPPELFDEAEAVYAPADDPVFELVPPVFDAVAKTLYGELGELPVSSDTLWTVYRQLLLKFCQRAHDAELESTLTQHRETMATIAKHQEPLMSNIDEMQSNVMGPAGYQYVGGLTNPPMSGLRNVKAWSKENEGAGEVDSEEVDDVVEPEYVIFTDEEEEETGEI